MADKKLKEKATKILKLLEKNYPQSKCTLDFKNSLQLVVATILAAQCTDERVNIVTKDLFKKYRKPEDYVEVPQEELEEDIHTTGFFRNKAKNIQGCCRMIIEKHGGKVPGPLGPEVHTEQRIDVRAARRGGDRHAHATLAALVDQRGHPRPQRDAAAAHQVGVELVLQ